MSRSRTATFALALLALASLLASSCILPGSADEPDVPPVVVGSGSTAEANLVALVLAELLRAADIPVEMKTFGHRRDARQAIKLGEVDVVPSYTGAIWLDDFGWSDPPGSPETSYERVSAADRGNDLVWLPATGVNARFAFVVRDVPSSTAAMTDNTDLVAAVSRAGADQAAPGRPPVAPEDAILCVDEDFAQRADGLEAFERLYSLRLEPDQVVTAAPEDAVYAVAAGDCLAGLTTTTDGRAYLQGLKPLGDEQLNFFPAFVLAPVVTSAMAESRPETVRALERFGPSVTNERLAAWNARVIAGESPEGVAVDVAEELIAEDAPPTPDG